MFLPFLMVQPMPFSAGTRPRARLQPRGPAGGARLPAWQPGRIPYCRNGARKGQEIQRVPSACQRRPGARWPGGGHGAARHAAGPLPEPQHVLIGQRTLRRVPANGRLEGHFSGVRARRGTWRDEDARGLSKRRTRRSASLQGAGNQDVRSASLYMPPWRGTLCRARGGRGGAAKARHGRIRKMKD